MLISYGRSTISGAPDSDLSEYEREARKGFYRTEFHNPLGAVTIRFASIHTLQQRLIERIKKDKDDFLDMIILISIQQMQDRINQLLEDIQQLIAEMEELRDKMLKQLEEHQKLLDGAKAAMKNGRYDLDGDGNFKNPYLRLMVDRYMKRNDLDQSELQDMTIEQLRAMVVDEIDIVEYEYQELSTQTGIISRQIEDLHAIKDDVQKAKDILDSDLPDHVKQQQVREIMNDIDIQRVEDMRKSIKSIQKNSCDSRSLDAMSDTLKIADEGSIKIDASTAPKDVLLASI